MSSTQAQAEAKALPDTFIHGASAFWVPMQPQPEVELQHIQEMPDGVFVGVDDYGGLYRFTNPHAVGDILFEREEWYCDIIEQCRDEYSLKVLLENTYYHVDGECCQQIAECCCCEVGPVVWQPAPTIPSWAARKRYTVATVEAIKSSRDNEWGWVIELEDAS